MAKKVPPKKLATVTKVPATGSSIGAKPILKSGKGKSRKKPKSVNNSNPNTPDKPILVKLVKPDSSKKNLWLKEKVFKIINNPDK